MKLYCIVGGKKQLSREEALRINREAGIGGIYQCPYCSCWHMTSQDQWEKRRRNRFIKGLVREKRVRKYRF